MTLQPADAATVNAVSKRSTNQRKPWRANRGKAKGKGRDVASYVSVVSDETTLETPLKFFNCSFIAVNLLHSV